MHIKSAIIVVSDRISTGTRENKALPLLQRLMSDELQDYSYELISEVVVPEGYDTVVEAIARALKQGA